MIQKSYIFNSQIGGQIKSHIAKEINNLTKVSVLINENNANLQTDFLDKYKRNTI